MSAICLWPILAVVLPFFTSLWLSVLCVIAIPLHYNKIRKTISDSVYRELLGQGKQPYEARIKVYALAVERDGLYAFQWSSSQSDQLGLFSDNPIGNAIQNLMEQQIEAADQGRRIINRIPESARIQMLKGRILKRLMQTERSTLDDKVWRKIGSVDLSGPLGPIGSLFDEIQPKIPNSLLSKLEIECRKEDERNFKDLPMLAKPEVIWSSSPDWRG